MRPVSWVLSSANIMIIFSLFTVRGTLHVADVPHMGQKYSLCICNRNGWPDCPSPSAWSLGDNNNKLLWVAWDKLHTILTSDWRWTGERKKFWFLFCVCLGQCCSNQICIDETISVSCESIFLNLTSAHYPSWETGKCLTQAWIVEIRK